MFYAIFRQDTGAFHSLATALGPGIPGAEFGAVPYEVAPDLTRVEWDPVQRLFRAKAPAPIRVISKRAFTTRIPGPMRRHLIALRDDPATAAPIRAALTDATELRDMVTSVNLDDPAVVEYVPFATDQLIAGGFVPAGDRAAFIATWRRDGDPSEAAA